MIEFLLATTLSCSESKELIQNIMDHKQSIVDKYELIEVIKTNTKEGCYEGSEYNS